MSGSDGQAITVNFTQDSNFSDHLKSRAEQSQNLVMHRFTQPVWIVAECFNATAFITVTWAVVALLHYGVRNGKFSTRRGNQTSEMNAAAVYRAALAAFVSSYIRLFADQVAFNVGYGDQTHWKCEYALDVSALGYFITLIAVYVFLWLKQRSLYHHPALKSHDQCWIGVISWSSVVIIFLGVLIAGSIFVTSINFFSSSSGCVSRYSEEFTIWPMILLTAVVTAGQILMLFLFIFPLRKHAESQRGEIVTRMFKRSATLAVVCVVSDVLALTVLEFALIDHFTRHMVVLAYEYNMLINLVSVLFSFESWRKILWSPLEGCNGKPERQKSLTSVMV